MASGKTHTLVNVTGLSLIALSLFLCLPLLKIDWLIFGVLGGLLGTIFLSPDLDLKQSRSTQAWGWFRWIWYAYYRCFAHRKSSHLPFIGTLSRVVYLAFVALTALACLALLEACWQEVNLANLLSAEKSLSYSVRKALIWLHDHRDRGLAMLAGLMVADTLHLLADFVYSLHRKLRARRPKA